MQTRSETSRDKRKEGSSQVFSFRWRKNPVSFSYLNDAVGANSFSRLTSKLNEKKNYSPRPFNIHSLMIRCLDALPHGLLVHFYSFCPIRNGPIRGKRRRRLFFNTCFMPCLAPTVSSWVVATTSSLEHTADTR